MYRSILVPLDGSAFGEHALALALSLARRSNAQLHLAHVHIAPRSGLADTADAELRAAEQMYLEEVVQRIAPGWQAPVTTMLLDGPIVPALCRYAEQCQADLFVMSTHGRGALSRFWLGSTADALIRQTTIPLLLARPHTQPVDLVHAPAVRHILIPLDGSVLAEQVLPYATALGRLTLAHFTLLQAIEPIFVGYGTELYAATASEQVLEQIRDQAQGYLDRLAAQLRADGFQVQTITTIDLAAEAILNYAQEHAVDLIALETHGRSGLARWLVGGVADKVIRGASVPVLLHRPPHAGEWPPLASAA